MSWLKTRQATTRPGVGAHNIGRDKTHVRRLQRTTTKLTKKTLFIEAPFLVCGVMRGRRGLTVWREGGVQGGANGIARYWLSHLGLFYREN